MTSASAAHVFRSTSGYRLARRPATLGEGGVPVQSRYSSGTFSVTVAVQSCYSPGTFSVHSRLSEQSRYRSGTASVQPRYGSGTVSIQPRYSSGAVSVQHRYSRRKVTSLLLENGHGPHLLAGGLEHLGTVQIGRRLHHQGPPAERAGQPVTGSWPRPRALVTAGRHGRSRAST